MSPNSTHRRAKRKGPFSGGDARHKWWLRAVELLLARWWRSVINPPRAKHLQPELLKSLRWPSSPAIDCHGVSTGRAESFHEWGQPGQWCVVGVMAAPRMGGAPPPPLAASPACRQALSPLTSRCQERLMGRQQVGQSAQMLLLPSETFTMRALSGRFYPKWLTISTFDRRKRNNNVSLSVQKGFS